MGSANGNVSPPLGAADGRDALVAVPEGGSAGGVASSVGAAFGAGDAVNAGSGARDGTTEGAGDGEGIAPGAAFGAPRTTAPSTALVTSKLRKPAIERRTLIEPGFAKRARAPLTRRPTR